MLVGACIAWRQPFVSACVRTHSGRGVRCGAFGHYLLVCLTKRFGPASAGNRFPPPGTTATAVGGGAPPSLETISTCWGSGSFVAIVALPGLLPGRSKANPQQRLVFFGNCAQLGDSLPILCFPDDVTRIISKMKLFDRVTHPSGW